MKNIVAELPIEDFVWKKFSLLETILHKFHLFFNYVFCKLFNKHDWYILVQSWNYSSVNNVDDFRLRCAQKLKCSCCDKISCWEQAGLSLEQNAMYNFYTNRYFKYRYSRNIE